MNHKILSYMILEAITLLLLFVFLWASLYFNSVVFGFMAGIFFSMAFICEFARKALNEKLKNG